MKSKMIMTVLAVENLKRARDFYKEVFNFEIEIDVPVAVQFKLPNGHDLMLYQKENFAENTGKMTESVSKGKTSGTELYFHVSDIESITIKLEQLGANKLSSLAIKPWGDEVAYYSDFDGNVLAIGKKIANSE